MDKEIIALGHGAGGRLSRELIERVFVSEFDSPELRKLDDGAWVETQGENVCVTTDAFVVKPLFFPGGDIGKLAVCGTINDLAVMGAKPTALCCSFVLEEGLELPVLKSIVGSMAGTAKAAGVPIVAGDTKVVERGAVDGVFITTTGIGQPMTGVPLGFDCIEPGDEVVATGTIADHGTAVLLAREKFDLTSNILSDCAPIHRLVESALSSGAEVKFMRDPTRGGLATVLNEIASARGVSVGIEEVRVPIATDVAAVLELLGIDPFYVASEGRCVMIVSASDSKRLLDVLRDNALGGKSEVIGRIGEGPAGMVTLESAVGGRRILPMLSADQLPRIC